jgi:hypothetical protein
MLLAYWSILPLSIDRVRITVFRRGERSAALAHICREVESDGTVWRGVLCAVRLHVA